MKIPANVIFIINCLKEKNHTAYLVGGAVRDYVLGKKIKDYDIATSATPDEIKTIFEKTVDVGESFGKVSVVIGEEMYDVATFRKCANRTQFGGSIKEDIQSRDFTINALYSDCSDGNFAMNKIIDKHGGLNDLRTRTLRTVGNAENRMIEDPIRILRAIRFAADLDMCIDSELDKAIQDLWKLVSAMSVERIRDEFIKMINGNNFDKCVELLIRYNLMNLIIPGFTDMIDCEQPKKYHPEGDVYTHTMMVFNNVDRNSCLEMKLAALLHDISKPECQKVDGDKITFYNHDRVGSYKAESILRYLRFSNSVIEKVCWMVASHMKIHSFDKMNRSGKIKFARHQYFPDLIELGSADGKASARGDETQEIREFYKNLPPPPPAPLITGNDLIEMGYVPGPLFGKIVTTVSDLWLEDQIKTKEEAIKYIHENFPI